MMETLVRGDQKYGATGNLGAGSEDPATYTANTTVPRIITSWMYTPEQLMSEPHNWGNANLDGTGNIPMS